MNLSAVCFLIGRVPGEVTAAIIAAAVAIIINPVLTWFAFKLRSDFDREQQRLDRNHERDQQLRERQLLVAADFFAAIEQTLWKCRLCWEHTRRRLWYPDYTAPMDLLRESAQLVEELGPQITVLSLLFGPASKATEAATEVFEATRNAQQSANDYYYATEDRRNLGQKAAERTDLSVQEREQLADPSKRRYEATDSAAGVAIEHATTSLRTSQEAVNAALTGRVNELRG